VTLVRLALAYAAVAALFIGVAWATGRAERGNAAAAAAEALILTLLGALWFTSLGRGGWVPVFLLIGVLASGVGTRPGASAGAGRTARGVRVTVVTTIRYVVAGGLMFLLLR
jgi:hypothetical protein